MNGRRTAGVVLTGGTSERMGVDKSMLVVDGQPMALRVIEALRSAGCSTVECQGGDIDIFAEQGVAAYPDRNPGAGPVSAIQDALARNPDTDVVIAACDLVDLDGATVSAVIAGGVSDPSIDVSFASAGGSAHLVCWWREGSEGRVHEIAASGVTSFRGVVARLRSVDVDVDPAAIRNVNTPTDLADRG